MELADLSWPAYGGPVGAGRAAGLGPQDVLRGADEVHEGRTFALSLPLDLPGKSTLNPNRRPPHKRPNERAGRLNVNCDLDPQSPSNRDVMNDDRVDLDLQYSTHWDGLAHVGVRLDGGAHAAYFGGVLSEELGVCGGDDGHGPWSDAGPLSVHHLAETGMQTRGVMLNLVTAFGTGRRLVGYDDLCAALADQKAEPVPGDVLCLYTGFADALLEMGGDPDPEALGRTGAVLDGTDERLLSWITDSGVVAVAADNYSVEHFWPAGSDKESRLPLHQHCLRRLGVFLGELWHLGDLAAALETSGRTAFMLTAPPLNLRGAFASPTTPIATI